jgi:hypothetical protein
MEEKTTIQQAVRTIINNIHELNESEKSPTQAEIVDLVGLFWILDFWLEITPDNLTGLFAD